MKKILFFPQSLKTEFKRGADNTKREMSKPAPLKSNLTNSWKRYEPISNQLYSNSN